MDVKIKGFFTKKTAKYKLLEKNVGNTTHNTFLPFPHSFAQISVSRKQVQKTQPIR